MKKLVLKLIFIFLTVTLLSIGLDVLYRQAYSLAYHWPEHLWIMPEIDDKYEIVKLGNSHAQEGIAFDRYNVKSLSLASVAQSFEYDLANLKMHQKQIKAGAVILINISPISFSQRTARREDSLQTVYYGGTLSPFLIPHLKVEDYLESQIVPFYRAGFLWRAKINRDIRDRTSEEEAKLFALRVDKPAPSPAEVVQDDIPKTNIQTDKKGNTFIPAAIAPPDNFYSVAAIDYELAHPLPPKQNMLADSMNFIYNKWSNNDEFGTKYFKANRKQLEELIAYIKKMNWRPVLITIPISTVLKNGLGADFIQIYIYDNLNKTDLQGAEFLDFYPEEQLTKNSYLYGDSDHLNDKGAIIYSYKLLRRMIEKGYLPPEADGYIYNVQQK